MKELQRIIISVVSILVYALVYSPYSNAEPNWYKKTPRNLKDYYGVGFSAESMNNAEDNARVDLILSIAVTIHVEVEQTDTSIDDGEYEKRKNEFKTRNRSYAKQESLPGVEIIERKSDGNKHYALARLSEEKFCQYIEKKQKEVKRRAEHGDKNLGEGDVIAALKAYQGALKIAQTLKFLYNETENMPDSPLDVDIEHKITSVQKDIHILKSSGDQQTGNYGSSLPESLVVKVYYQDEPLREFPLKAIYTRGTGRLKNSAGEIGISIRIYTDIEGTGRCRVGVVKSISRENYIRITADAEVGQLPASKAVDFRYASVFPTPYRTRAPIITLNGSTNEQTIVEGNKVDIEISVPNKCHVHLFSIVANGDFGYIQSVPIERTYEEKGWRVISTNSGWALQIHQVPLTAGYGLGLETLLVITTEEAWEPERKQFTMDSLIHQLDNSVGENSWRVGWVSYHIVSKEVLTE